MAVAAMPTVAGGWATVTGTPRAAPRRWAAALVRAPAALSLALAHPVADRADRLEMARLRSARSRRS
jgi:hypothetical protein